MFSKAVLSTHWHMRLFEVLGGAYITCKKNAGSVDAEVSYLTNPYPSYPLSVVAFTNFLSLLYNDILVKYLSP